MIKPEGYDVRIFTDHDALNIVLDMPAGEKKESIAVPASVLTPCEHLVKYRDEDNHISYYFLFIIPETRDKRLLVVANQFSEMVRYIIFGTSTLFSPDLREDVVKLINQFKEI